MNKGAWHQCGDKSQRLVLEQLQHGVGSGVVISPRDLALHKAVEYAFEYRQLGAAVLLDQQFYVPEFTNSYLDTYPISAHRAAVSALNDISDSALDSISDQLEQVSRAVKVDAIVAPAVIYQAARGDIVQLNARMFAAAKRAGDSLGVPTYATVVLGQSVANSSQTLAPTLSQVTALGADGWYFAFEFDAERVPSESSAIVRAGNAMLTLACTGKPVFHAYAGPLSLLSFGFGATAAGVGHSQNTWRFTPERWHPAAPGGGGAAPPRFFSTALWGTIIYPDETVRLPNSLAASVLTHSPFSAPVAQNPPGTWGRWDANKHLVYLQGKMADALGHSTNARQAAGAAINTLAGAMSLHAQVDASGLVLGDNTGAYQSNWHAAATALLASGADDYDFLEMLR